MLSGLLAKKLNKFDQFLYGECTVAGHQKTLSVSRMHLDFPEIKKACHLQEQTVGNMTQTIHAHLLPCSYA